MRKTISGLRATYHHVVFVSEARLSRADVDELAAEYVL